MFSYTHTDIDRPLPTDGGREVFYPMGWDDNGLPTERRVENYYGIRCDPTVAYDPGFTAVPDQPAKDRSDYVPVSRPNFIELCLELLAVDEAAFEQTWKQVGLSVDWSMTYTTVGERPRGPASGRSCATWPGRGLFAGAPSLWDTTFQTAVAQAELEDRERPGAFHRLAFHREDGSTC